MASASVVSGRHVARLNFRVAAIFTSIPLGVALFSSGAAGLVNQVVWQRALKVFLGGSEAISSMIVVLVFMAGLGLGSILMGNRAAALRRPLVAFAAVEMLLACLASVLRKRTTACDGVQPVVAATKLNRAAATGWQPSIDKILAFGLGFCSLGYEMYLFRLIPLRHEPLPFTFAAVLTGFLLFWSLGAAARSTRWEISLDVGLRVTALASVATLVVFISFDSYSPIVDTPSLCWFVLAKFPYFIPCFLFGYLFALVASRASPSSSGSATSRFPK